jgi:hypothetical protein
LKPFGTRLVRGRFPDARDTVSAPPVAVVSETFASHFFGTTDPGLIMTTVLRGAFVQIAVGFVAGSALAMLIGRLLESILFGVSVRDPQVPALSGAILGLSAGVAAAIPAARAARIDPIRALRVE